MKKRFSILLSVLLSISLLFPLTSCVGSKTVSVSDSSKNTASDTASDHVTPASDFEYKENEDGITVTKYIGDSTEVVIPETIDGKPVTAISYFGAFQVTSVSMPDTMRVIESSAFMGCSELETVHFSSGLLTIETRAFNGCSSLKDLVLPESLTEICSSAFETCTALKEITIPKNVVNIEAQAFYQCTGLERILFVEDSRLEEIGSGAFMETMVKEIAFPSSLRKLYMCAFAGCSSLKKVTLNDGLSVLSSQVFAGTRISELIIPASVEHIDCDVLYKQLNPVALYFEGDLPEDFFVPAQIKPKVDDVTIYLHEGARGFDLPFSDRYTIKTW